MRRAPARRTASVALTAAACVGLLVVDGGPGWTLRDDVAAAAAASREAPATVLTIPTTFTTVAPPPPPPSSTTAVPEPVTIAFGGDVHFQGTLGSRLAADPATAFAASNGLLAAADVTIVNLETAVTSGGQPEPKQYRFRTSPAAFDALRAAGVDVVSMANNHGLDYGVGGVADAVAGAAAAGMPLVGIGEDADRAYRPAVVEARGRRIAVLAATDVLDSSLASTWTAGPTSPGLASAKDSARLLRAVTEAQQAADVVVVLLHWGVEGATCPTDRQQRLARSLVGAGADVVAGSHAHRLQGGGHLGSAVVGYGLGNLAFYNRGGVGAETGLLDVTLGADGGLGYRWSPAAIRSGVPVPLDGAEGAAAVARWESLRACTNLGP